MEANANSAHQSSPRSSSLQKAIAHFITFAGLHFIKQRHTARLCDAVACLLPCRTHILLPQFRGAGFTVNPILECDLVAGLVRSDRWNGEPWFILH